MNDLRKRALGLLPLNVRTGPDVVDRAKVPWTYCMSPGLVPKPADWSNHIGAHTSCSYNPSVSSCHADVVGFYFLDLATGYTPPPDLLEFLGAGPPPVYIGFGSVVVENPDELTRIIFEATRRAGVRALVSPGWGNLGGTVIPEHIFILPNVPSPSPHPLSTPSESNAGSTEQAQGTIEQAPNVTEIAEASHPRNREREQRATLLAAVHLLNPLVFTISTRGSSESVLALFVLLTLDAAARRRWTCAAVLLGLATHWKIYPFVYGVPCLSVIVHEHAGLGSDVDLAKDVRGLMRGLVSRKAVLFVVVSAGTFALLCTAMYAM